MEKGLYLGITKTGYLKTIALNGSGIVNRNNNSMLKTQRYDQSYYEFIEENKDLIKPKNNIMKYAGYQINDKIRFIEEYTGNEYKYYKSDSEINYTYNTYYEGVLDAYAIYDKYKDRPDVPSDLEQTVNYLFKYFFAKEIGKQLEDFLLDLKEDCHLEQYPGLIVLKVNSQMQNKDYYLAQYPNEDIEAELKAIIDNNFKRALSTLAKEYNSNKLDDEIYCYYQGKKNRVKEFRFTIDEVKVDVTNIKINNVDERTVDYSYEADLFITGTGKSIKLVGDRNQNFENFKF